MLSKQSHVLRGTLKSKYYWGALFRNQTTCRQYTCTCISSTSKKIFIDKEEKVLNFNESNSFVKHTPRKKLLEQVQWEIKINFVQQDTQFLKSFNKTKIQTTEISVSMFVSAISSEMLGIVRFSLTV